MIGSKTSPSWLLLPLGKFMLPRHNMQGEEAGKPRLGKTWGEKRKIVISNVIWVKQVELNNHHGESSIED